MYAVDVLAAVVCGLLGVAALTLKGLDPHPMAPCISIMACLCSDSSENRTKPYPLEFPAVSRTTLAALHEGNFLWKNS